MSDNVFQIALVNYPAEGTNPAFSSADQLRELVKAPVIRQMGDPGVTVDEMVAMISVWKIVKGGVDGEVLEIPEEAHTALVTHLKRIQWASFHPYTAQLLDDVLNAPRVKAPETTPG